MDDAVRMLVRPASRIACGLDSSARRAVVRAVAGEDLGRPVTVRAILIAFSLASLPPSVNSTLSMSPGRSSASFRPSRARTSVAMNGLM